MITINPIIFQQVVNKALVDAAGTPWVSRIERAASEIESNPYIERDDHGGLLIGSPSGNVYSANGACQCEAYAHSRACWHRAAAKLIKNYDRFVAEQVRVVPVVKPRPSYAQAVADINELFA